ncbi:MAG TPA: hypothetical protein VK806_00470 [Bacteroidia bacterium]|nr:hypothetical protein [Bacteroidia bacterium]
MKGCIRLILVFFIGFVVFFGSSCKKTSSNPSTPSIPPFQAYVNAYWMGTSNDSYTPSVQNNSGIFTITGKYTSGSGSTYYSQGITIITNITGTGTYNLNYSTDGNASYYGGDAHVSAVFNTDSTHIGTLNVTYYNSSTSTISGSFNFNAYSAKGLNGNGNPGTATISGSFYQLKW